MRCSESSQRRWSGYLECRGWIHQETLCNGISVTFDLSQPLALGNGFIEAMRIRCLKRYVAREVFAALLDSAKVVRSAA